MLGAKCLFLNVLYAFASHVNLFVYFKRRYDHRLVQDLNHLLRLKGKCVRTRESIKFLRKCLDAYVAPTQIKERVRKAKPRNPRSIERAFIRDENLKSEDFLQYVTAEYRRKLPTVSSQLSFFDKLRFCKLLNCTAIRVCDQTRKKKDKALQWLKKSQLGHGKLDHSTIVNLAGVELSETEKDVLCRGLNFGVLPKLSREEIEAEFELCWQQLDRKVPNSQEAKLQCKATLADLSQKYAGSKADRTDFPLDTDHLKALNGLKKRHDIIITRPDKGNGVVVLDRSDYLEKMEMILSDTTKFQRIGDAEGNDNTLKQERALQAFLLREWKAKHITRDTYDRIRPVGSTRPRMYGLPKLHKPGAPLRPILSMVNAPQHEMAKWLAETLKPVFDKYSNHTVKDTFEFCANIADFSAHSDITNTYMCSFDVTSLFTNIPLAETIRICLDTLYRDPDINKPSVPENLLEKLLRKATTEVEFSFDGVMYKQIDGVAMGSPLGPVLANIFVGFWESKIDESRWPMLYNRFVDDTFSVFLSEKESLEFFEVLNNLHPSLRFTVEGETNDELPFMDVLLRRDGSEFIRSVFRKPTFTGQYTRWDSFAPTGQKINLMKSLTYRANKICSKSTLPEELKKLKSIFISNGYPEHVVDRVVKATLERAALPEKCSNVNTTATEYVTIRLPWLGRVSSGFRRDINAAIVKGFSNTQPRVVFTTNKAFSGRAKDVLPTTSKSFIIYQFTCCCKQTYVGRTSQCLSARIEQHIPRKLLNCRKGDIPIDKADSAVTRHLKESQQCRGFFDVNRRNDGFRILAHARHDLHLEVLEALFIRKLSPTMCAQKKHVRALQLSSLS